MESSKLEREKKRKNSNKSGKPSKVKKSKGKGKVEQREMNRSGEYKETKKVKIKKAPLGAAIDLSEIKFERKKEHIEASTDVEKKDISSKEKSVIVASQQDTTRGVVYLGHIPYGFFEDQLRGYFSQFGVIVRLRLARNAKTGKSKHFAFIEFEHENVAKVVAETMNNYIMFGRALVCKFIPYDQLHPAAFLGTNKTFQTRTRRREIARNIHNQTRSLEQRRKRIDRLLLQEDKKKKIMKDLKIGFKFPKRTVTQG